MIPERLNALRALMKANGMDAYILPTSDFHASEYVGGHFKTREYLSGFTGSAGTLVVLPKEAGLWTDGRYFLQAEAELAGSGITLFRAGEPDVPEIPAFLCEALPRGGVIGADGRTLAARFCLDLLDALEEKQASLVWEKDLTDELWADRPPLSNETAFLLEERYTGESAGLKLARLRKEMAARGANVHVLTSLDDIAWLFNLRGNDVQYNPVALAYAVIEEDTAYLFLDQSKLSPEAAGAFTALNVTILPYKSIYTFIARYQKRDRILLDPSRVNYALYAPLAQAATLEEAENPTILYKAVKNAAMLAGMRRAHEKDGAAIAKFLCWLKTNVGHTPITEMAAAQKMDDLRLEQGALGPSFSTIAGYGAHAAIIHYSATPQTDIPLEAKGLLLVDSGGQYLDGTTDVTRTIALGPVTQAQRRHFTLVLQGMLRLSRIKFPAGCGGEHLDVLARAALWEDLLDYGHGTGHGVGAFLCVHEPPVRIRWRQPGGDKSRALQPGMVVSDEPGVYIPNSHGVRTENLLAVQRAGESQFGAFLCFETLTLAPIDLDAVELSMLSGEDREQLNAYHVRVYETIAPQLSEKERDWLKGATRAV